MPQSDARQLETFSNLRQALAPLETKLPEAGSLRFSGDVQTVAERLSTFFESTENLKLQLARFAGFTPGARQLQEVSVCLRQGRETLRMARSAEISVRPILAYYGLSSLAKALALSYGLPRSLAEMPPSHGLRAPDEYGVDMHRLRVRVKTDGLFHRLVDSLRQRTWFPINLHCKGPDIDARVLCPSAASEALHGADCTLQSLLRKIPGLEDFYYQTFGEAPLVARASYHGALWEPALLQVSLRVESFLRDAAYELCPGLKMWRHFAGHASGELLFENLPPDLEPRPSSQAEQETQLVPVGEIALPLIPGRSGEFFLTASIEGATVPDTAILFMAAFLLGSIARYRPDLWLRVWVDTAGESARMRALIDSFYDVLLDRCPLHILASIARAPIFVVDGDRRFEA